MATAAAFDQRRHRRRRDPRRAGIALPRPSPETLERVRRHPYVRLALNGSFTALWAGQLISLFGDRIHQVALASVVFVVTGSASASRSCSSPRPSRTSSSAPSPGTFVDRWDHREVLIVSDLLRAAIVLLIPLALVTNLLLVYPLVFLMTSISIFFRPARVRSCPSIVDEDELVTANSALWVGETLADVVGYPLAGLFVAPWDRPAPRVLAGCGDLRRVGPAAEPRSSSARRPS